MKLFLIMAALAATLSAAAGCGSSAGGDDRAPTANANSSAVNQSQTAVVTVDTSNVNVSTPTQAPMANATDRSLKNPTTGSQPIKPTAFPAPENSEYVTTMNDTGMPVETRTFKGHPQILKVVRTWLNTKDKKIEVHLKNGKIAEIASDKLEDVKSAPASAILQAAGIQGSSAAPAAAQPPKQKAQ